MPSIRKEQFDAFLAEAERKLALQIAPQIRQSFPETVANLSERELLRRVRAGIRKAARYDLQEGAALLLFVSAMFAAGPDFDKFPLARHCLIQRDRSDEERMDLLFASMLPGHWEGAAAYSTPDAWDRAVAGIEP